MPRKPEDSRAVPETEREAPELPSSDLSSDVDDVDIVAMLEADRRGVRRPVREPLSPREVAEVRELNWLESAGRERNVLASYASEATQAVRAILGSATAKDADRLKAAEMIYDRVGLGRHSSQDVNVSGTLDRLIDELDEAERVALQAVPDSDRDSA